MYIAKSTLGETVKADVVKTTKHDGRVKFGGVSKLS